MLSKLCYLTIMANYRTNIAKVLLISKNIILKKKRPAARERARDYTTSKHTLYKLIFILDQYIGIQGGNLIYVGQVLYNIVPVADKTHLC